jgi:hypothetical protein
VSDQDPPSREGNRRPPSGPVSSPRAYFGRASRAATGALRVGISESSEPAAVPSRRRPPVYRAGDPALRLFAGFTLPLPPTTPLTGAIATLSGIRDGEHEKLYIDLGTSLVRAAPQRDEKAGTLTLILSRTQSAETYAALLASLRYVNDAPTPTNGVRRIALQTVDAGGRANEVGMVRFGVGEAPPEEKTEFVASDQRVVIGETFTFNADGDYTLFWWPSRLPPPAERARRAAEAPAAPAAPTPDAAAGSFFSAGGKVYRLFEAAARTAPPPGAPVAAPAEAPAPVAPPAPGSASRESPSVVAAQAPRAANDSAPAKPRAANDSVWVPGRGAPPPGFERARALRLEDIFGSDMQDAMARRLIDLRLASGG